MTAVTTRREGTVAPEGATGAGFCRIQIAAPTTRVDLAVPTAVPLAALLPGIVSFAEQDWAAQQDGAAPHGWALSRLDGARLDPGRRPGRRRGPGGRAAAPAPRTRDGRRAALRRRGGGAREGRGRVRLVGPGHPGRGCRARDAGGSGCGVVGRDGREPARRDPARRADAPAARRAAPRSRTPPGDVPAGTLLGALAAVTGAAFGVVLLGPRSGRRTSWWRPRWWCWSPRPGPRWSTGGDAVFLGLGITALLALLGGGLVLLTGATPARPRRWPPPSRWHLPR